MKNLKLFDCHRSIAKSIGFYFLLNELMIKKSSFVEIQNLVMNLKSQSVRSNSEQYQFLLSTFPAKINDKIFQNTEKTQFNSKTRVNFAQSDFFLKTPAMYNCRGLPGFQRCRLVVKPNIIPPLSTCKNSSKNLLNSSNHLWHTPGFRVPWSIRPHSLWLHTHPPQYFSINF